MSNFTLEPFPTDLLLPQIEISGQIDRHDHILSIEYQLLGDLDAVAIAPPAIPTTRKFDLWEATCFEFFIGVPGDQNYWEFNLSPSGDWNVFYFDDYRQGLRDETTFTSLPLTINRSLNSLVLRLEFDLSKIISTAQHIEIAVTTVVKSTQDHLSYWALTHRGEVADFHRRDGFMIKN